MQTMMRGSLLGVAALAAGAVGGAVLGFMAERTVVDPPEPLPEPAGPLPTPLTLRSADGTRLAALVSGPLDAPAVLLVHGLSLSQDIWVGQRRALEHTMRVLTLDLRGHGDSDDAVSDDYGADRLGQDVLAGVAALGDVPTVVVGHSMGGMAVVAGLASPARPPSVPIAGVVLINSAASAVLSGLGGGWMLAGIAFARERVRSTMIGRALYGGVDADGRLRGNDLATVGARVLGVGTGGPDNAVDQVRRLVLESRPHVAGEMWRTAGTADLLDDATSLTMPMLLIAGARDRVLPAQHSRRLAERIPHAQLVVLPDVGHVAMLERPDEVSTLIARFARRVTGG